MLYVKRYALGAPAFDDLSIFEKKEDAILSFYVSYFTNLQWLLCKNIITRTTLQLTTHSSLRMLQYLWHGRVRWIPHTPTLCLES